MKFHLITIFVISIFSSISGQAFEYHENQEFSENQMEKLTRGGAIAERKSALELRLLCADEGIMDASNCSNFFVAPVTFLKRESKYIVQRRLTNGKPLKSHLERFSELKFSRNIYWQSKPRRRGVAGMLLAGIIFPPFLPFALIGAMMTPRTSRTILDIDLLKPIVNWKMRRFEKSVVQNKFKKIKFSYKDFGKTYRALRRVY